VRLRPKPAEYEHILITSRDGSLVSSVWHTGFCANRRATPGTGTAGREPNDLVRYAKLVATAWPTLHTASAFTL
jgi:hypothetical protein